MLALHINAFSFTPVVSALRGKGLKLVLMGQGGTKDGVKLKDNILYYIDRPLTIDLSANQKLAPSATAMIFFLCTVSHLAH